MDIREKTKQLKKIFQQYQEIKLVYLFGSYASGGEKKISDVDLAIYIKEKTSIKKKKDIVLSLIFHLEKVFQRPVDLTIIDFSLSPIFLYQVIKEGKVVYEIEPYRLIVETKIFNLYFDFKVFQKIHHL